MTRSPKHLLIEEASSLSCVTPGSQRVRAQWPGLPSRTGHFYADSVVNRWFSRRSVFPAAMHPQPLVRVARDIALEYLVDSCRVGDGIGLVVPCSNQRNRRLKANSVLSQLLTPDAESRDYGRVGMQDNTRNAGCRAGRHA